MNSTNCPVCLNKEATATGDDCGGPKIDCPRCGKFKVGWIAGKTSLANLTPQQRANLSGWIREHQGCTINAPDMAGLTSLRTPSVGEKADKIMLWLLRDYPKPGTRVPLFDGGVHRSATAVPGGVRTVRTAVIKPEMYARSWAQDDEEVLYLTLDYLAAEKHFIEDAENGFCRITPAGWAHLDSLSRGGSGVQGFIAMWINDSMNEAWKTMDQGIRAAGYNALRIDQKQHNNEITDEIIAEIRKSKFLVADLTDHRNGVYFEAGFAKGLGLQVVWLCRKDELDKAHFDTRQYNFIVWEADKLAELSKALQNRIEATIGRGPLQPAT